VLVRYDIPGAASALRGSAGSGAAGRENQNDLEVVRPRWDGRAQKELVRLTLPLGVVGCLVSLNPNVPRYFLERGFGEEQLGVYSALAYLMVVGWTLVSALGQAASPKLSKHYAEGRIDRYRALLMRLVIFASAIGLAGVAAAEVAGREILSLLYKREYAQSTDLFFWLMAAAAISYVASSLTCGVMAARYFFVQMPLSVAVLLTSAACSAFLIPAYGMIGAAWAVVISSLVQLFGNLCVVCHAAFVGKADGLSESGSNSYGVRSISS